ncbi:phosphoribosyltransferase-like protein [Rhizobium leguminosarum]
MALQFTEGIGIPKYVAVSNERNIITLEQGPRIYDLRKVEGRAIVDDNEKRRPDVVFIRNRDQPDLDCPKVVFDRNHRRIYQAVTAAFAEIVKILHYREQAIEMPIRYLMAGLRSVFDDFSIFQSEDIALSSRNIEKLIDLLTEECRYVGKTIDPRSVRSWIDQFDATSKQGAIALLNYIRATGYHSTREIATTLTDMLESRTPGAQLVSIQPAGKSEGMLLYEMRKSEKTRPVDDAISEAHEHIVCVDDVIGSGDTILERLFETNDRGKRISGWLSTAQNRISIVAAIAHPDGISNIEGDSRSLGKIKVYAHKIMSADHGVFSSKHNPFAPQDVLDTFRRKCGQIGSSIYPATPFGWGNCAWGIVTEYNVPDCSLPIIWSNDDDLPWSALFPRR